MKPALLTLLSFMAVVTLVACQEGSNPEPIESDREVEGRRADPENNDPEGESEGDEPEAADEEAGAAQAAVEEDEDAEPKRIFAKRFVVAVRAAADRESARIGYLRAGTVLQATTANPVGTTGCDEGWYELTTGGFVCAGRDVIPFLGRRLPSIRARQPDLEAPLPYEYGYIRRRTPQYRRLPNDEEAMEHEGWRPAWMIAEQRAAAEAASAESGTAAPDPTAMAAAAPAPAPAPAPEPAPTAMDAPDEPTEPEPVETLAGLRGERRGIVRRTLTMGFYVALDRQFRRGPRRYWRTQDNGFVPRNSVRPREGSSFQGFEVPEELIALARAENGAPEAPPEEPPTEPAEAAAGGETGSADEADTEETEQTGTEEAEEPPPSREMLGFGFVTRRGAVAYTIHPRSGRFARASGRSARTTDREGFVFHETRQQGSHTFLRAHDGRWFREYDVRRVDVLTAIPDRVTAEMSGDSDNKWMDVNLEKQTLVAYEGTVPVFATLVSTGRIKREDVAELNHETPTGVFRISSKHLTHTMDGDNAFDGPYSVDDVPYVMYFQLAYALHSAFWHGRFGRPKSHGCVNLAPQDARYIYSWSGPHVPQGWHVGYPTDENKGSLLYIHGETPRG